LQWRAQVVNDKAQVLLATFLKFDGHVSRIGFNRLRHRVIKNGIDDAGYIRCERKMMLLGETVDARAQDAVFGDDFSDIKPDSPPLHSMLRWTRNERGAYSTESQILA
jgi:hypothetical protein